MAVKIKVIQAKEFLSVTPDGDLNLDKSKQLLVEIAKAKRVPADYQLLIDLRKVKWKLSTSDVWYLAAELTEYDNMYRDQMAILIKTIEDFDTAKFFELCAENLGFGNIDIFSDFEEAINWLCSPSPNTNKHK